MNDKHAVACNTATERPFVPLGALCYIGPILHRESPNPKNVRVLAVMRSRSGRWVQHWTPLHKLTSFRLKTLPWDHPRYNDPRIDTVDAHDTLQTILELTAKTL